MSTATVIFDEATKNPNRVREALSAMHQRGETVEEVLELVRYLEKQKISVPHAGKVFDVCGTGGSGKKRINLSIALAVKLSEKYPIAKHGNRASSGHVGSFDIIEAAGFEVCDTPEKVQKNIREKNLAFVFAPAFHPALKTLTPIRASLSHPTIFNFIGPLLNPVENITAQLVGVSSVNAGTLLSRVAGVLGKNILFVHDTVGGLDDVSILGKTKFWEVRNGKIETGTFVPEDFGIARVKTFEEIQGGNALPENVKIFHSLLNETAPEAPQKFLEINQKVADLFFRNFVTP